MQRTIICGKGRLGQLIAATLSPHTQSEYARIDATRGLIQKDQTVTGTINTLILCFVPKHEEGRGGWQGLLDGVLKQVQSGVLKIQRVLFISSTAVYEAIENGFVDVQTKVSGSSVRSQGLLEAENIIPQLAANTAIFRLTGLVGPGYNKYDPLTYSHDKPRQAVDTRAVAAEVSKWFLEKQDGHRIEILIDGFVYWQGNKLDIVEDYQTIEMLSQEYRLLKSSLICR